MKTILLSALAILLLQACSNKNEVNISKEACTATGGTFTDGQCFTGKQYTSGDMKKNCEAEGTEYSAEHDGCLLSADEMQIICKDMGMKYSEQYKGCIE